MVNLIKDYYLTADKYQYIVGRMKQRKRGERMTSELMEQRYYPTLAAAVSYVADEVLRQQIAADELTTIEAVADRYQSICNELINQLDAAPRELRKKVKQYDH